MEASNGNKKKILIVDDDENLRTVLLDKFTASGFEAVGASDGEEGLKTALAIHPDIMLLDVMMPKMDGWEVLKNLRKDVWGQIAKVVMLTSLEGESEVAKALEKGTFDYFTKTNLNLDEIVKRVNERLGM